MANSNAKGTRWTAPTPRAPLTVALEQLQRSDVWVRVLLCSTTAIILWLVTAGWSPSFPYRARQAPLHNLHARASFEYLDAIETSRAQERARRTALVYYQNDPGALTELREALIDRIFQVKDKPYAEVNPENWQRFLGEKFSEGVPPLPKIGDVEGNDKAGQNQPPNNDLGESAGDNAKTPSTQTQTSPATDERQVAFERFVAAVEFDTGLEGLKLAVENALLDFFKSGLLKGLEHEFGEGSTQSIMVHSVGNPQDGHEVDVAQVRIGEISPLLHQRLRGTLEGRENISDSKFLADRIYDWLMPQLPTTLTKNEKATERSLRRAELATPPKMKFYAPGSPLEKRSLTSDDDNNLIAARQPLGDEDIKLLRAEHAAFVDQLQFHEKLANTIADWGMYFAVFALLCGYLYTRDRTLLDDIRHFSLLLGLFLVTIVVAWVLSINVHWRVEMTPFCMFSITIAIAYHRELALLMGALAAMVFTISHGFGIGEFVILTSTCFTASLLCGRIRSRTRLVYIGLISAAVALPTTIGIGILTGQPLGYGMMMLDGVWYAGSAILAGLLMTALLPFLEQWFGIETDISLLELSDANHPLLKQLVQRAPGTYNHSINVASISEAAAESIGANGLLCRVGAYFHDIGKMRKPEYFIENQGSEGNKHDDLVPTMSTLVIIAHVKDGAEMARRNYLPQRIIDMIEQHHGTTLVEYFYQQATKKSEADVDSPDIEEADFRYPGPKPQTTEAAVVMLGDSVESASRTLREPTPARIENLVKSIFKKKLDDGQFDECSITLEQLRTIEESLIKSLNAMYHARVKYPEQQQPA